VAARYRVEISSSAVRQLAALPKRDRQRIDARILALANDPRPTASGSFKRDRIATVSALATIA
jgi:mRNA-degrading endonuclease RelE of RelBE toxin-antitoxin system